MRNVSLRCVARGLLLYTFLRCLCCLLFHLASQDSDQRRRSSWRRHSNGLPWPQSVTGFLEITEGNEGNEGRTKCGT